MNQEAGTHQGVEIAGIRLTAEIMEILHRIPADQIPLFTIAGAYCYLISCSVLQRLYECVVCLFVALYVCDLCAAHSLGGLISRCAIGKLEMLGAFNRMRPLVRRLALLCVRVRACACGCACVCVCVCVCVVPSVVVISCARSALHLS